MDGSLKKLSIAFYWHMHQPVYELDSVYLMPWARLHAVKDYLDMVLILEKHPNIKLNVNIVPALVDELIDYSENGFNDIHSSLTMTPVENLSDSEKEYILNNFFTAEYETMIYHHPTYRKLYKKRYAKKDVDIEAFTNQEYSDLMALFNLAWIDPTHLNRFPELRQLHSKEKGFTLKDRIKIIDLHRKIISEIIPTYREYIKEGRIELTTSPYNHPILPILCDVQTTIQNAQTVENLPEEMDLSDDAYVQVKRALDRVEEVFGVRPKGLWASEHCLTTKVLELLKSLGIKWTVSDESILSKTINFEFIRDFKGNLEDPYHLLKVYEYSSEDSNVDVIFRDSSISNLINFEYSNINSKTAAEDLYNKIKLMQSKLLVSPDDTHILTIAQDGENCWERYKEDGAEFLNTLYSLIEKDSTLETVCLSDYIENDKTKRQIEGIYPGSWINKDFQFWIGDSVKNLAWNYLTTVRQDIIEIAKGFPDENAVNSAMQEIYIAEGSDWFWWYGEPNNSGQDNIFDFLFREHLKKAYKFLNSAYPEFLDKSVIALAYQNLIENEEAFQNTGESDIDFINSFDLIDGPVYRENKLCDKIDYGFDKDNVYLRLHMNPNFKNADDFRPRISHFFVYMRKNSKIKHASSIRVANNQDTVFPVMKKKYHYELLLTFVGKVLYQPTLSNAIADGLWERHDFSNLNMSINELVDIVIPFEQIDIKKGQKLELFFVAGCNGTCRSFMPKDYLLQIVRPK